MNYVLRQIYRDSSGFERLPGAGEGGHGALLPNGCGGSCWGEEKFWKLCWWSHNIVNVVNVTEQHSSNRIYVGGLAKLHEEEETGEQLERDTGTRKLLWVRGDELIFRVHGKEELQVVLLSQMHWTVKAWSRRGWPPTTPCAWWALQPPHPAFFSWFQSSPSALTAIGTLPATQGGGIWPLPDQVELAQSTLLVSLGKYLREDSPSLASCPAHVSRGTSVSSWLRPFAESGFSQPSLPTAHHSEHTVWLLEWYEIAMCQKPGWYITVYLAFRRSSSWNVFQKRFWKLSAWTLLTFLTSSAMP